MKTLLIFLIALAASIANAADKAQPAEEEAISKEADVTLTGTSSGGKRRNTTWETDYGSREFKDTSSHMVHLKVTSRLRKKDQRVLIEFIWITRPAEGGALEATPLDSQVVKLLPSQSVTVNVGATVSNTDSKYVAIGYQEKTGQKYIGWSARAVDGNGKVIAITSSLANLDAMWKTQQ